MWNKGKETHLCGGDFLCRRKVLLDQAARHAQTGSSFGLADKADDGVKGVQRLAGPVFADLAEEAVFDRIPLGSTRGVVTDGDGESEGIDQLIL